MLFSGNWMKRERLRASLSKDTQVALILWMEFANRMAPGFWRPQQQIAPSNYGLSRIIIMCVFKPYPYPTDSASAFDCSCCPRATKFCWPSVAMTRLFPMVGTGRSRRWRRFTGSAVPTQTQAHWPRRLGSRSGFRCRWRGFAAGQWLSG